MIPRFQLVPSAYVLVRRTVAARSDVLLLLREGTGYMDGHWACVAGHVDPDESAAAAAVREAREEVGLTVRVEDLEPLCGMHRTSRNHRAVDERIDLFFQTWSWTGDPRLVEPDKAADLRWWPLDRLPSPVVPHEALVLSYLRAGHVPPLLVFGFDET